MFTHLHNKISNFPGNVVTGSLTKPISNGSPNMSRFHLKVSSVMKLVEPDYYTSYNTGFVDETGFIFVFFSLVGLMPFLRTISSKFDANSS